MEEVPEEPEVPIGLAFTSVDSTLLLEFVYENIFFHGTMFPSRGRAVEVDRQLEAQNSLLLERVLIGIGFLPSVAKLIAHYMHYHTTL